MRRPRHQCRERDAGVDPISIDPDVGLQPVDPVDRQPLDRLGLRRLGEVAQ